MKEYRAYFSYYSEQYGYFDDTAIKVEADNPFDARSKAWDQVESCEDLKFASCIRLCGITWESSPLNMQDYLNAEAAEEKYRLKRIENVEYPNAQIEKSKEKIEYCKQERSEHYGSLWTIQRIAADFGRPYGMIPPMLYEELHYAREFLNLLYDNWEEYSAFLKKIERAEKWDSAAMLDIRDSFRHGFFSAEGHDYDFSKQLDKGGLYPVYANRTDRESKYIYRWENAREYSSMTYLPFFGETDIIANSHTMQYDWQTLVLNKELLQLEYQTPINSLWIANQGSAANFDTDGDRPLVAENPLTGEVVEWKRTDFLGVLRPEKIVKINFEAIKAEYQTLTTVKSTVNNVEREGDDEEMEV